MNSTKLRKIKLVFLGESNVGKSSLITRFIYDSFEDSYVSTTGIDFLSKTIHLDTRTIRLQLWDTAGQERFKSLIPNYIRDCDIAVVMYDITNKSSFIETPKWIEFVQDLRGDNFPIMLVGNKIDIKEARKIAHLDGEILATKLNCKFIETSAKTAFNVNNLFKIIAQSSIKESEEIETDRNKIFDIELNNEVKSDSNQFKCCNLS